MFQKKSLILSSIFIVAVSLLFLTTYSVHAAPIDDFPVTVTQPDGTILTLFASGDEYYNWLRDSQGFTVIQDPDTGYYVYADLVAGELVPTEFIAGKTDPLSAGLRPNLNISAQQREEIRQAFLDQNQLQAAGISNAPHTGTITNLVVFIRFSGEQEFTDTTSTYTNMLNSSTAGANSLRNYFREVSYDALTVNSTLLPTPGNTIISYQDSHPRSYYQPYNATTNPGGYTGGDSGTERTTREHTLLRNAINYVNGLGQFPGASTIDADNDGTVDSVVFVVSGSPTGWSSLLWPHAWVLYTETVSINNKTVSGYQFQLQSMIHTGVLAHETFHVLGAPDLYHYVGNGIQPVGAWDVMEANMNPPQHMSCYMKFKYGNWISDIPELTALGTYTLNPLTSSTNNCKKIASPNSSTEYFVLEYRRATGSTFESSLPGSGLLVYRINTKEDGNAGGPPDEVYVYRPGGTTSENGNVNAANFSSSVNRTAINDNTDPSSFLSDGSDGGLNLCNIGATNATISFDICSGGDTTPPSGSWASPGSGQTISTRTVTLTVNASDNAGGSGVKEVRFSAKWDGTWRGIGTDSAVPYSMVWDMCSAGVPNGDVELGFEVWDNANNKWVYSEHLPNYHINKNYSCTQSPDTTPPTGSWISPNNGQTFTSPTVTLSVSATDNSGGSGVREVRWSAKWDNQWSGIGTDNSSPYSIDWDMCAYGVPNGDIELGMEVWDNANNKWVYSEHFPNYHINKDFPCNNSTGGWETWGWQNKYLAGFDNWHGTVTWDDYPYIWWDFGTGGPFGWGGNEFSLRMQKDVYFPGGSYSFHTEHDDGVRVYVDGNLMIDAWWDGDGGHDAGRNLSQGNHQVKVEFYENQGDAKLHVYWYGPGYPQPDTTPPDGLITSPVHNSAVSYSPFQITADAWDDVSGVDRVEFYAWVCEGTCNWRLLGTDSSAPYFVDWDWASLTDQHVYLTIHVVDKVGNVRDDPGGYVEVDLDRIKPTASILSPSAEETVAGIVPIIVSASDGLSGVATVQFFAGYEDVVGSSMQGIPEPPPHATLNDAGLVTSLDVSQQDYWKEIGWDSDGSNGWSFDWDTAGVPEQSGAAVFAYAYDKAGNYEGAAAWNLSVFGPPGNDDFDSPIHIDATPYSNEQNTTYATVAADDRSLTLCGRTAGNRTVWYRFTPASDGRLSLDTLGSNYDTMLAVWEGARESLNLLGCNDDRPFDFQSELTIDISGGQVYYIEVSQFSGYLESGFNTAASKDLDTVNELSAVASTLLQFHASFTQLHTISGNVGVADADLNYTDGEPLIITADTAGNYSFKVPDNWSGTVSPSKSGYTFTPANRTYSGVTTNRTGQNYTANPITYTLTINRIGNGTGTVTSSPSGINCGLDCSEPYAMGATVTLSAAASTGHTFAGWTGNADCSDGVVTMDVSKSCTAIFNVPIYTLTVTKDGSGIGTVTSSPTGISCGTDCSQSYLNSTIVTLTATAAANSTFIGWSGGGCSGTGTCTVTVTEDVSVTAMFVAAPILIAPSNGSLITEMDSLFMWDEVIPAPDHYEIQLAKSNTFDPNQYLVTATTWGTAYQFSIYPGATYYWRVRAIYAAGQTTAWSPVWKVKTGWKPPLLISPSYGELLLSKRPTFEWQNLTGGSFSLQVSSKSDFSILDLNVTVTGLSYTSTKDLNANRTYYWRMRTNGINGPSTWSTFSPFKTGNPPSVPVLSLPAANALVTDYTPLFKWSKVTLPVNTAFDHYQIQVSSSPSFWNIEIDENVSGYNSTQFTPGIELSSNTKYYWRVRSFNTDGHYSGWSAPRSFRAAILPPVLNDPVGGITVPTRRPDFDWEDVDGATGYKIVVSKYVNFSSPVVNVSTTNSSYSPTVDLPAKTTLYWHVQATGPNGPGLWSANSKFTTGNPPGVPVLLAPANNVLLSNRQPKLDWSNSTIPAGTSFNYYQIQLAKDTGFTNIVLDQTTAISQLIPSMSLDADTKYYWRVRVYNTVGQYSAWSAVRSFREAMYPPGLLAPENGSMAESLQPVFDWSDESGAKSYTIQISTTANFSTFIVNSTTPYSEYAMLKNLPAHKTIYWRVRVNGPNGPSAWSKAQFTTP